MKLFTKPPYLIGMVCVAFIAGQIDAAGNGSEGIALGYITGNEYRKLEPIHQMSWFIGVMDGIMAEDTIGNRPVQGPWLGQYRCLSGVPKEQLKAIFERELDARPDGWHLPAGLIVRQSLKKFCDSRK